MESGLVAKIIAFIYFSFGLISLAICLLTLGQGELEGSLLTTSVVLEATFAIGTLAGGIGLFTGHTWGKWLLLAASALIIAVALIGVIFELSANVGFAMAIVTGLAPLAAITAILWSIEPDRRDSN